jgi:hypothetical protein
MYFFLISALDRQEKTSKVVATFLTCPLGTQPELRSLELWNNERWQIPFKNFPTIKFVYCPPGISWSKTLESDALTFASKQPYSILTWLQ